MFDKYALNLLKDHLDFTAAFLQRMGIHADFVTFAGFIVGVSALPFFYMQYYPGALGCILVNRLCDGVDGALARQSAPTESGAFLDIVMDFIFYGSVVFGFALADPQQNGFAACLLLLSFIGTGSSFLGFAVLASQKGLRSTIYPSKGFYYLGGLTEGSETILFFIVVCLFPGAFVPLAYIFSLLCMITTASRVVSGYMLLRVK